MYSSESAFSRDVGLCNYQDVTMTLNRVHHAYQIYRRACAGVILESFDGAPEPWPITIIGRRALQSDGRWLESNEEYPSIDAALKENLGIMDGSEKTGSVLEVQDWSLLANDSWLLGSIEADTEFHFASPPVWTNLWNDQLGRLTVLGRELIGILSYGYRVFQPNPKLETVAVRDAKTDAQARLPVYVKLVNHYSDMQAFLYLVRSAGVPI